MNHTGEMQPLGAFEPSDAKRLLPILETNGIPFEVEADDSALTLPGREVELATGLFPTGSRLRILVPASDLQQGLELVQGLYPVESPPEEQIA